MGLYFSIILGMVLVNNYPLAQFLGICPFLGVSKKLDSSLGMGVAVIFVMVMATAATWPIMKLLSAWNIAYLQTIVFILVIAALVQFVEMVLKKFVPSLHKALGVYLPLITTNCAVLGVCINNIDLGYNYPQSLVNAFGAGVVFLLAMLIFSGMRQKLENNDKVPKPFQGVPITMTTAALLSLAFMGFGGLV
jgi:electron transport complex protein RnfA